jgi:hypothetical protein
MKNKNLRFMKLLIATEKLEGVDSIKRYTHGECDNLVYYLKTLNDMEGERIRIFYNEDEEEYNPTLHFVYKINDIYYDINGGFTSIEKLIQKCPLFDNDKFDDLEIYSEEDQPADLETDTPEYETIMNIIKKINKKSSLNSNKNY